MSDFSTRFKKARIEIGKSQEDLAVSLGSSRTRVVGWEKKEPDFVSVLNRLQTDFNINLNWLISGIGEIKNKKEPDNFRAEVKQAIKELIDSGELAKYDFKQTIK